MKTPNERRFISGKSIIFTLLLLIVVFAGVATCAAAESARKIVVISADSAGIELLDPDVAPGITGISENGAAGLMVTRTLKTGSTVAAHSTLGSGLRSEYTNNAGLSFGINEVFRNELASDIYYERTGMEPNGQIFNIAIGTLQRENADSEWEARPGALGTLLRSAGLKTAVIGNSDYSGTYSRKAVLIAMDELGCVDGGNISYELLSNDKAAPWGVFSDPEVFTEEFKKLYPEYDFIVIEYGDIIRSKRFEEVAIPSLSEITYKNAIERLDRLATNIFNNIDVSTTQLIILSPTPSEDDMKDKKTLTPVIMGGLGVEKGVLSSASTKREGIIMNTDFAPHVARFFNLEKPVDFIGAPIVSAAKTDPLPYLRNLAERDTFVEQKHGLLKSVIIWHLAVLVICFVGALKVDALAKKSLLSLTALVLFTVCLFFSFLVIAGFPTMNTPILFPSVQFLICVIFSVATGMFRGAEKRILFISSAYFALISIDQLTGGSLIKNSVLGYYPQVGARFYGIGNEFMGFMISAPALLLGTSIDLNKRHAKLIKLAAAPILLFSVYIVGSPSVGANFGGLIACSTSALFMMVYLYRGKVNIVTVFSVILFVAIIVAGVTSIDVMLLGGKTHVGQLADRVVSGGGPQEIVKVAARKLAINIKLLRVSFWSALFIISVAIAGMVHYFPLERLKNLFIRCRGFQQAYVSSLFGALAAFAFNDSGIVPGATALILPTACLFLLIFSREHEKPVQQNDA